MKILVARLGILALSLSALAAAQRDATVERLRDPVTGRAILRYASPRHETHHYYFVSPWSPNGDQIVFFQFAQSVEKLTATGRYPGALVVMNADGSNRRELAGPLSGHYHTGANQLWGPNGEFVYFQSREPGASRMARIRVVGGEIEHVDTPVPCGRLSPDGSLLSCGNAQHQGVLDLRSGSYRQLTRLSEARTLTPNRLEIQDEPSQLQNTRFSPDGEWLMIVHRTREAFPRRSSCMAFGSDRFAGWPTTFTIQHGAPTARPFCSSATSPEQTSSGWWKPTSTRAAAARPSMPSTSQRAIPPTIRSGRISLSLTATEAGWETGWP